MARSFMGEVHKITTSGLPEASDPWKRSHSALDMIANERHEQLERHDYGHGHDDDHRDGELADAAAAYALVDRRRDHYNQPRKAPRCWPWERKFWKPGRTVAHGIDAHRIDRIHELVKAGALIVAEIERIRRSAGISEPKRSHYWDMRAAIERHRDARGHDRCWLNDLELYKVLGGPTPQQPTLPEFNEFMGGCADYYYQQTGKPRNEVQRPKLHPSIEKIVDTLWSIFRVGESRADPDVQKVSWLAVAGQTMRLSEAATELRRMEEHGGNHGCGRNDRSKMLQSILGAGTNRA